MFIDEFTELILTTLPDNTNNVYIGDFNLHVNDDTESDPGIFNDTVEAMGLIQHEGFSTHKSGNILDLVLCDVCNNINIKSTMPGPYLSDHQAVITTLNTKRETPPHQYQMVRSIAKITPDQWNQVFNLVDKLEDTVQSMDIELKRVLDKLAPETKWRTSLKAKQTWYVDQIKQLKHITRKLEKKWLKHQLESL